MLEEIFLEELQFSDRLHCVPESLTSEFSGILSVDVGDAYNSGRSAFYRNSAGFKHPPLRQVYGKGPVHSLVLWNIEPGKCHDPAEGPQPVPTNLLEHATNTHLTAEYEKGLEAKIGSINDCNLAGAGVWEEVTHTRQNVQLYVSVAFYCEGASTLDDHLVNPSPEPPDKEKPPPVEKVPTVKEEEEEEEEDAKTKTDGRPTVVSGFYCTGSMRPTLDCRDKARYWTQFTPDDIDVGTIIVFNRIVHRVIEARGVGLQEEYRTQGDNNVWPDRGWTPFSAITKVLIEVLKGANPKYQETYERSVPIIERKNAANRELVRLRSVQEAAWRQYFNYVELNCTKQGSKRICSRPYYAEALNLYNAYNDSFAAYELHYNTEYKAAWDAYKQWKKTLGL